MESALTRSVQREAGGMTKVGVSMGDHERIVRELDLLAQAASLAPQSPFNFRFTLQPSYPLMGQDEDPSEIDLSAKHPREGRDPRYRTSQ